MCTLQVSDEVSTETRRPIGRQQDVGEQLGNRHRTELTVARERSKVRHVLFSNVYATIYNISVFLLLLHTVIFTSMFILYYMYCNVMFRMLLCAI